MTARIILYARAAGTVLSWPLVAIVALVTEIARQTWTTLRDVWAGSAGLSVKADPNDPYAKDREKRRKEVEEAEARRKERAEKDARRPKVGAIYEDEE
ncbi:MAG: hypothetical protein KJ954_14170 [Alphaproteobacteria bacterium]|nr:hypothetical protein [Alphaproteobacteria bacterium]